MFIFLNALYIKSKGESFMPQKTLLQTVVDILDTSLKILKNHSSSGKDGIGNAEKSIEKVKQDIAEYKKKKGDEPYNETVDWDKV